MSIAIFTPAQVMALSTKEFPRKNFLALGGTYIGLGAMIIILAAASIGIGYKMERDCMWERDDFYENDWNTDEYHDWVPQQYEDCHTKLMGYMPIVAFTIVWGVLFVITGGVGLGMAKTKVAHRQSGMKTLFTCLSVLGAIYFAPVVVASHIWQIHYSKEFMWTYYGNCPVVVGALGCVVGGLTFFLSIIAVCMSSCFAPVCEEVKVIAMPQMTPPSPVMHDKAKLVAQEALNSTA